MANCTEGTPFITNPPMYSKHSIVSPRANLALSCQTIVVIISQRVVIIDVIWFCCTVDGFKGDCEHHIECLVLYHHHHVYDSKRRLREGNASGHVSLLVCLFTNVVPCDHHPSPCGDPHHVRHPSLLNGPAHNSLIWTPQIHHTFIDKQASDVQLKGFLVFNAFTPIIIHLMQL